MPKGFNFGVAHGLLLEGKRVARMGWNGVNMYLLTGTGRINKC